jgi:hypothetical protein
MSDDRLRFAAALGVPAAAVRQVQRVALPAGLPVEAVWLGVHAGEGGAAGALAPDCDGAPCAGPAVDLGPAAAITPLAVVDLQGRPTRVTLFGEREPLAAPGEGAAPALLLRTAREIGAGQEREALALVTLASPPRRVLAAEGRLTRADGSGFQTLQLQTEAPAAGGEWLDVLLLQHALPPQGASPAMPGPPLLLRHAYRDGAYRRTE